MDSSRRNLFAFYGCISFAALVGCLFENMPYYLDFPAGAWRFWQEAVTTGAARSLTWDIFLMYLLCIVWMVRESRIHGIKHLWAYIAAATCIGVAVPFPIFLIVREVQRTKTSHSEGA